MRRFKPAVQAVLLATGIAIAPAFARADLFGGDDAILASILENAITQLAQLRSILETSNDSLGLMRDLNRGINDSLRMAETLGVRIDPGVYRELGSVNSAIAAVEATFGKPVDSPLKQIQTNSDRAAAEAISFNNETNEYANRLDRIGEEIKAYSHAASPGGAAKLTAESLGVMIHVLNQQLRATGHGLKLQAQAMAVQNKREKDATAQYLKENDLLSKKMKSITASFEAPRF